MGREEEESFREISKTNWVSKDGATREAMNVGSLQRIADATEVMAQNFIRLQDDRDLYKKWYREEREENKALRNTNRSLRGWITRLKNQSTK